MAKKLDYSGPARPGRPAAGTGPGTGPRTFRGHPVPAGNRDAARSAYRRETDAHQSRNDWLVPLVILAACSLVWFAYGLIVEGLGAAAVLGGASVIVAAFNAVVGLVAAYVTAALFGASFGPFWTAVLKLAAASTTATTVQLVIPLGGCVGLVIFVGVLVLMLNVLLDLDGSEAKWFTLFFVLIQLAAAVGIGALLGDALN